MKTIKRVLLFCLLGLTGISASAEVYSGDCGIGDIKWSLDTDSGVLVISGEGEMWFLYGTVTWRNYAEYIHIVEIKDGVTSIGESAFSGCSSLTSITIPNSVTSIASYTFDGCSSLTSITIPNSVTSIEESTFRGCSSLTSVTIPNSVTSIANYAFDGCSSLTSITFPTSVRSIGKGAFRGRPSSCSDIVEISNWGSTNYTAIVLSCQLQYYYNGKKLEGEIEIPSTVTQIGDYALYFCKDVTSITIPNSVTSIGGFAFYGCSSLTSITIPNSVTSIGEYAFAGCSSLTGIVIPNSVTSIANYTFSGCSSLTSITIPNSVTSIGSGAFRNCSRLPNITIPNSVTSFGSNVFEGCSRLTNIAIEIIDWGNQSQVATSLALDGKMLYYLYNGKRLKGEIEIPNTVTAIGANALYNCQDVTGIVIPNSVTSIGERAFSGTTNLETVKVEWMQPLNVDSCIFDYIGAYIQATLYVPKGKASMYQTAAVWKDFYDIQEYDEEGEGETYQLTFKTEGGRFVQSVDGGKSLDISIVADAGWEIHSATFNGTDITPQLVGTRYYTPAIREDSELNVVFRQKDNRVGAVAPTDVKVRAWAGTIHVSGADERADVVVYDASGVVVKAAQGNGLISLGTEGVFIIKVDGETFKVRM